MNHASPKPKAAALALAAGLSLPFAAFPDPIGQAIDTETATTGAAIDSQRKIDRLDDDTRKMLEEYRSVTREAETLETYNRYLKELLASQETEKRSLLDQLKEIETTQREIVPLMLRMLDSLETFVKLDMPFLPQERRQRVNNLREMINRADITNSEKYRRILEAFQIENDYGRTIEAYRAELDLNGTASDVDFLRIGRLALFYQRLDGSETGTWDREEKRWEPLPDSYRTAIRDGLRIARKEAAPDLLTLPIPAPEEAK